jgi:hypothetical protein
MKKTIRLTESDLVRLVKRVIKEQTFPIDIGRGEQVKVATRKDLGRVEDNKTLETKINPKWDNFLKVIQTVGNPQIINAEMNGKPFTSITWRPYDRLFSVSMGNEMERMVLSPSTNVSSKVKSDPKEIVEKMKNWWKNKGYQIDSNSGISPQVLISFDNPEIIASDLQAFFRLFPVE